MDGVEEGGVVGVEDGVVATFVVDVEGSEGFGMSKHCEFFFYWEICGVWSVSRVVKIDL